MRFERKVLVQGLGELKGQGYGYLVKITAVDYGKGLTALYFIRDLAGNRDETVEVEIGYDDAWVPTVMDVYPAADWYEREMMEMFGIGVHGRVASRLLLEKWDGVDPPLRKSFQWNAEYRTADNKDVAAARKANTVGAPSERQAGRNAPLPAASAPGATARGPRAAGKKGAARGADDKSGGGDKR